MFTQPLFGLFGDAEMMILESRRTGINTTSVNSSNRPHCTTATASLIAVPAELAQSFYKAKANVITGWSSRFVETSGTRKALELTKRVSTGGDRHFVEVPQSITPIGTWRFILECGLLNP
jgi:hypothetical protein